MVEPVAVVVNALDVVILTAREEEKILGDRAQRRRND
jgi:hypothetical protein